MLICDLWKLKKRLIQKEWENLKGTLQPQNKFYLDERSVWPYLRKGISFLEIFLIWEKFDFVVLYLVL